MESFPMNKTVKLLESDLDYKGGKLKIIGSILVLSLSLLLAGCGSSGGDTAPPIQTTSNAKATVSSSPAPSNYQNYLNNLKGTVDAAARKACDDWIHLVIDVVKNRVKVAGAEYNRRAREAVLIARTSADVKITEPLQNMIDAYNRGDTKAVLAANHKFTAACFAISQ